METFIKVIGIAFVAVTTYSLLKQTQPQFASVLIVAAGVLILIILTDHIKTALGFFGDIVRKTGIEQNVFSSVIKIVGIGYLTEYSVSLCEDSGCLSLSKKIELGGKLVILVSALPILTEIIRSIGDLM